MRSSSCIVWAVKYDSPQLGQDHMGIRSTTNKSAPVPKLRVTYFSCTLLLAQKVHDLSTEVDGDDNELAVRAKLCDDCAGGAFEGCTLDDVLDFAGRTVTLALDDLTREDDVLKVEDGEVVIFKFVRGMS